MRNNKNGSFTCFIAIITTCTIVLMTILMKAASIRSDETLLAGMLIQQQDLVLSEYSEKLLDWYGIYATQIQNSMDDSFQMAAAGIERISFYKCEGIQPIEDGNNLKTAILDFSRPRVPMQLALQLLSRFTKINTLIESSKADARNNNHLDNTTGSKGEKEADGSSDAKERMSAKDIMDTKEETVFSFEKIIGLLQTTEMDAYQTNAGSETSEAFTWANVEEALKNSNGNFMLEMDLSKEIKSSLTVTENNLNEISSFLEQFYQIESNSFYDKLCMEFYASTMFSCKANTRLQDGIEIERRDLRNRMISSLPVQDKLEIEKIIFGCEKSANNEFFAKISIETIRFLIHLISNLSDDAKKIEISMTASALCAAIALASGGAAAIPQKAMEVVVLLLISMNGAAQDYRTLIKGGRIALFPNNKSEKMDTYYMDYLQIFLFAVPEQVKINRMISIMRKNLFLSDASLYTGVSISVEYRDIIYKTEGQYDGYRCSK